MIPSPDKKDASPIFDSAPFEQALGSAEQCEQLAEKLAAQSETILFDHASCIDNQVRTHTLVSSPDGTSARVKVVTEQMRRTRAVPFGGRVLQLRDFYNDSTAYAEFPKYPGAILLCGTAGKDVNAIENPEVLARFHRGKAVLEFDFNLETAADNLRYLGVILDAMAQELKDVPSFGLPGATRHCFEKHITAGNFDKSPIETAKRLHTVLLKAHSLDELEKPFRKQS